jgi:Cu-processing system permease protein
MSTIQTVFRFELADSFRSRWMLAHGLLYLVMTEGLLLASGFSDKALVSLINVVLLLVPLISLVFGIIHQYNSREFVELMLTQPVRRRDLFLGLFSGTVFPLVATFALGVFLPFAWHGGLTPAQGGRLAALLALGSALTITGLGTAFALSLRYTDRVRGIGVALLVWLAYAVLYDGAVLLGVAMFDHYPIDKALLGVMLANPVDLARLLLLQVFDAAAMMGYTGAVFTRFFGSLTGILLSAGALVFWMTVPAFLARRLFERRDF